MNGAQKIIQKGDSVITYCAGGGLAGFSCVATQLQPIIAVTGGVIGIGVCLAKGYYDFKKHRRNQKKW